MPRQSGLAITKDFINHCAHNLLVDLWGHYNGFARVVKVGIFTQSPDEFLSRTWSCQPHPGSVGPFAASALRQSQPMPGTVV